MENKKSKESQKDKVYIINKVKHKPLILENIFSYSKNRPFILFNLIIGDKFLKSSLTKTFQKSQKKNELTKDLNINILNYISFRKIYENLTISIKNIENNLLKENNQLNSIIEKKKNYKHFFENKSILNFINNTNIKNKELLINLIIIFFNSNYRNIVHKILEALLMRQEKEKVIDKRYSRGFYYHIRFCNYTLSEKKRFYENYFESISVTEKQFNNLIEEQLNSYKDKTNIIKEIKPCNYYEYCLKPNLVFNYYLRQLEKENEVEKILEIIYMLYGDYFQFLDKKEFEFYNYPYITKKYRKICQKKAKENIEKNGLIIYENNKKLSIIEKILRPFLNNTGKYNLKEEDIINFCFDYFSTIDSFLLYNLPKRLKENEENDTNEFLDEKYLNFIENYSIKQMIKLICIIDRNKYCEYINNITYPYIYELHFIMYSEIDELFMFNDLPINEIYKIFVSYFITIKNFENIKIISFGDEFLINKNQFISYNDEYYQSILGYLIDQFFVNNKNKNNNILEKINLEKIIIKEDNLDNIYEKFKILYGFNQMFPFLKDKKILELKYEIIIDNKYIKKEYNSYKIIIIDFENKILKNELNEIINKINELITKNLDSIKNNIEMIIFKNIQIKEVNINLRDSNIFINLPNLKEFIINNDEIAISNDDVFKIKENNNKNNKFNYLYLGYNKNNNLIYFRSGINKIKATDILDIFNTFNNNIYKLNLKYENINIINDKDKNKLEIINLSKNIPLNKNSCYYYSLKDFSDLIIHKNNLNSLIIDGFDFKFDDIKNTQIKNLSINYYKKNENECNKIYEYLIDLEDNDEKNILLLKEDLNLSDKFINLETISLGNIKNDKIFCNKLFKNYNFSNNLKEINIITFSNIKIDIKRKDIKINILQNHNSIKETTNLENQIYEEEEEDDDEYEYDEENEDLFNDKYGDILEEENISVINCAKNKKRKIKKIKNEENNKILLVGKELETYKIKEEKLFKNDIENYLKDEKILFFKSQLINSINHYQLINQSFVLINKNIEKIKFKSLGYRSVYDDKKSFISMNNKNLFIILKTEKGNLICVYLENSEKNKKGNDFYLILNYKKIFYYKNNKKKDDNEFFQELVDKEIKRKELNCFKIYNVNDILESDIEEEYIKCTKYENYCGQEVQNDDLVIEFIEIFKVSFE